MTGGMDLIKAERQRQIEQEGWTPEHDDQHYWRELVTAAGCYVGEKNPWPWPDSPPKLGDAQRNYTKAGALLLAEIDRLNRASERANSHKLLARLHKLIEDTEDRLAWVVKKLDGKIASTTT